ncbi:hypothetical protein K502DRAFT_314157 [Neoconidiobolus thromboides FSU 785]|nr:hypothetical protein K502DRAFT_314157 [Neoconidiobolus thromboides FSU 785]
MYFLHLETYHIIPALIGGFILFFGLISLVVKEKLFLSEALVAFVFGIIVGPKALNFFDPLSWPEHQTVTLEFSRIVIAIQVMAAGVYLPKKYLWEEMKSLLVLLLPVMFAMWLISAAIIYAFLPLTYLESLIIAACVTPTDPVLANSIVKGRFAEMHVPIHVRDILSAESGANDGLGFPYLFLAIFLMHYDSTGLAIGNWFLLIWGYQIGLSIVVGATVGFAARKLLKYAETNGLIDKESFLAFWVALALFLMGSMAIIGSDDLFSCFIAGNAFTWDDWFRLETRESHLQEVIDLIFNFSFFIYLGTIIPWAEFSLPQIGIEPWRLVVIGILVIVLRRIPALLLSKPLVPALRTWREAVFAGWFGPIGAGAIFYAIVAIEELETYEEEYKVIPYIFPVVSFLVICSIVVHGITIPLFYIGKHIRTRSIATSTVVNNMVSKLPKIQIGQEIVIKGRKSNELNGASTHTNVSGGGEIEYEPNEVFEEPLNTNESLSGDVNNNDNIVTSIDNNDNNEADEVEVIVKQDGRVVSDEFLPIQHRL